MCGPKPPDPIGTAQAQADINFQTALDFTRLNQINEVGPFGSRRFEGEIGSPNRTVITEFSPEMQALYDSQMATTQGLSDKALGRLNAIPDDPFTLDGLPSAGRLNATNVQSTLNPNAGGEMVGSVSTPFNINNSISDAGPIQTDISLLGLQDLPGINDFSGERQRVEDALFDRSTQRLGERLDQEEEQLRTRLVNQGIQEGSEAFDREIENFRESENAAFADARDRAILAGSGEQSRIFGDSLAARQQGVGEQFGLAEFRNRAQAQQFTQNTTDAEFANTAQNQQFQQAFSNAQLGNQATLADFERARVAAQFGNDAAAQMFGQNQAIFGANNALRQQAINERLLGRNQAFNEAASFLQGGIPLQTPQFQPLAQFGPAMAAPDAVGLAASNYQAKSNMFGSIFGSLGNIGAAYAGAG